MKRLMYYLDIRTNLPAGGPDREFSRELLKKGLRCRPGCGGIPTEHEGPPATVRFEWKPTLAIEASPRAKGLMVPLWRAIRRYLSNAIVGTFEWRKPDGTIVTVKEYVSVYVPVLDRVCLRGVKKYDICRQCGRVRCADVNIDEYVLASDVGDRRVVMSMSRGILVDAKMRNKLAALKLRGLRFYPYEIRDEPLDGRAASLDDWPQLAKWRKKRKR
jgi:hypothetical protein